MSDTTPKWGRYTAHALQTYPAQAGSIPLRFLHAFGLQKLASARANASLGELPEPLAQAIAAAAQELAQGRLDEHFPLGLWQAGDGNQTHLNVNEVLAARAGELRPDLPAPHPLDHVNRNQSSNDAWPTVVRIALVAALQGLFEQARQRLETALHHFAQRHQAVRKVGRTFLRDAHFTTVGAEFGVYASLLRDAGLQLQQLHQQLLEVPQGSGAVGTGVGVHDAFGSRFAQCLQEASGQPFRAAALPSTTHAVDTALLRTSGATAEVAAVCLKLCRDIELLASGPRCGIGELLLPDTGPGSSSMAGKINPTHASMLEMICMRVQANHGQVQASVSAGRLQLNTTYLLAACCAMESVEALAQGMACFAQHCVERLAVDEGQIAAHVARAPGAVFLRARELGYDAVGANLQAQGLDKA